MFTINLSIHDDDYSHATLIHLSSYRSIQKVWLINDLYEDIVIYFSYSNRWNIKNGLTDCGEPPGMDGVMRQSLIRSLAIAGNTQVRVLSQHATSHSAVKVAIALARAQAPHVILLSDVPVSYLTRRYI